MTDPTPPPDLDEVRKVHVEADGPYGELLCLSCGKLWPCMAIRLADEVERLQGKLAETEEGWRLGVEQRKINCFPETEAAVHIAELEQEIDRLTHELEKAQEQNLELRGRHDPEICVDVQEYADKLKCDLETEREKSSGYDARIVRLLEDLAEVRRGLEVKQTWINDLQAGMSINCVYCGHNYGPDNEVPATMADVLKEHIEQCPKHPMSALKDELAEARAENEGGGEDG